MPLMMEPDIDKSAKVAISKQMGEFQTRTDDLNRALADLLAKSHGEMGALVERARAKLVALRDRGDAISSPAHLNRLLEDFVGPSVVSAKGELLSPVGAKENPVQDVHGVIEGSKPSSS